MIGSEFPPRREVLQRTVEKVESMRVLLVGGSGYVGSLVTPYLKQRHHLRVLDLRPPQDGSLEHVAGSLCDDSLLERALGGMESLCYMVMPRTSKGVYDVDSIEPNYDLHVKYLHRVLQAAVAAGVRRVVYTSSMSVYAASIGIKVGNENQPCDAPDLYGFCKSLGEQVCAYFARVHALTAVALRLDNPLTESDWHQAFQAGAFVRQTAAPDVASAIDLALRAPIRGFEAIHIAGDWEGASIDCSKARQLLGWQPQTRPRAAHSL